MSKRIIMYLFAPLLFAGVFVRADLAAMPPHPSVLENLRQRQDHEGLRRMGARMAGEARRGVNRIKRPVTAQGNFRLLVLLVQYSNRSFASGSTVPFYSNLLNGVSSAALSMKKYYADMSGGTFNLAIDVKGPYTASRNAAYYGGNDSDDFDLYPATLVREAVVAASNAGVDFAPYDNDNDGEVDMVMVVHAGAGEEASEVANDIWSHAWELSSGQIYGDGNGPVYADGKKVDIYCIQPEYIFSAGDSTIGVFCHEFAHILGLPDLYDTEYESQGAGIFTIMSGGGWAGPGGMGSRPTPFLAWEKNMLGWLTAKSPNGNVVSPQTFSSLALIQEAHGAFAQHSAGDGRVTLALAFGLLASGLGFVWYTRGGGRVAALVIAIAFLLAAALFGVSCGESGPGNTGTGSSSSSAHDGSVSLGDIETTREAIVVPLGDPAGKQYYFLENKVRVNGTWTEYLPGDGLLITHIHDAVIAAKINDNTVNDFANRIHGVTVVEADNGNELWKDPDSNSSDEGTESDLFRSRSFTPDTTPATRYYTGTSPNWLKANTALSQVYIEDISDAGSTMTFKYSVR